MPCRSEGRSLASVFSSAPGVPIVTTATRFASSPRTASGRSSFSVVCWTRSKQKLPIIPIGTYSILAARQAYVTSRRTSAGIAYVVLFRRRSSSMKEPEERAGFS